MQLHPLCITLLAFIIASSSFALADQKIKTKSNIKNDRIAQSSCAAGAADCKAIAESNSSVATKETAKELPKEDVKPVEKTNP